VFDFAINSADVRTELSGLFFKRVVGILKANDITFDMKVLGKFVMSKAPDWRGILNTLQGNIINGELSPDILNVSAEAVVEHMKRKNWKAVNEWMVENVKENPRQIERELYNSLQPHLTGQGTVAATLAFGEYSYRIGLGADPLVTLLALAATVMMEAEWK
jgi:hypothetical protein